MSSSPPRGEGEPRAIAATEWLILALGIAGIVLLHDAYGISWDAYERRYHGELIRSYFLSLGADRTVNSYGDLRLYTALPDFLAALLYQGVPELRHQIRHAATARFALASVPALFRIAKLLGRPWAGPIASLILVSLPVFFGHAFINSKDIPLAAAFTWAMLGLEIGWADLALSLEVLEHLPDPAAALVQVGVWSRGEDRQLVTGSSRTMTRESP
ncbi:MAG: hypothetical protein WD960_16170 [Gemmatimonadota bacterium]